MAFVLDASAAIPWCFKDEETERTRGLQDQALTGELIVVPEHWRIELLNVLLMGVRRGRVSVPDIQEFWGQMDPLDIEVDHRTFADTFAAIAPLTRRHRLTAYDAAYLELAMRRRLPVATLDAELAAAANAEGVPLLLQQST